MPKGMDDDAWDSLLQNILAGEVTPFLGAGACRPALPSGTDLAERWATKYKFPLKDPDLMSVSQFLAVTRNNPVFPKREIIREFQHHLATTTYPDFSAPDNIHGVLARLPLPVYLTTNYDNFIEEALECAAKLSHRQAAPIAEYCRWHRGLRKNYERVEFRRDPKAPLVFHFHGVMHNDKSLVLTEDDYEDFLVELSADQNLIPSLVKESISDFPLLFVGYSLQDWSFRVLFRAAIKGIDRVSRVPGVTVQLSPSEVKDAAAATEYLQEKYRAAGLSIYWGDAAAFSRDLHERLQSVRKETSHD